MNQGKNFFFFFFAYYFSNSYLCAVQMELELELSESLCDEPVVR